MPRIAFYTFGILREPYGHPQVQGFFDRIDSVFEQAKNSEGFIALDDGTWGDYVSPRFFIKEKHAGAPATLSLWTDIESVCAFAYRHGHGEALKLREEWAVKPEWPTYVAWWVEDDHIPTREEASRRLEHLHDNGPTPFAFSFKKSFNAQGNSKDLDKELLNERVIKNQNKYS